MSVRPPVVAPPALRPGSRIAVVAPSSPFDTEAFHRGVTRLAERYDVRIDDSIFDRDGFLAGRDERRERELLDALRDPTVDAIVAARGGYGATRLLPGLDPEEVRHAAKLLVGFSDLTALHALWARAGVRSLHGPMVAALGCAPPPLVQRWMAVVEGAVPPPLKDLQPIAAGVAEGPLIGGNLAVLCALIGTPFAPPLEGRVLFMEDVGERPYRVDRMLTTLTQAGWLARVCAIVVGEFGNCDPGPDGTHIGRVLHRNLAHLGVPVLTGVPSGHVEDNLELPLGARVRVDANGGGLTFLEPVAVSR